jgi:enoyl-CoA hydratase/carnithine racemase
MARWSEQDGVLELALDREPCNEIGTTLLAELEAFLDHARGSSCHAAVIHSTVRGGFSAGADLRELYRGILSHKAQDHEPELRAFIDRIHAVMDGLDTLPQTTIGVVHGVCFGGGFELALTCDILVAERSARFCFPELRLGIVPGFGGIPRLRRAVGNGLVRDLLLTGRSINAKKALEAGLVQQMVPAGEGLPAARSTAAQVGKFDREAAKAAKEFCKEVPRAELAREKELFLRLALRPTLREALRRFVESDDLRPYLP